MVYNIFSQAVVVIIAYHYAFKVYEERLAETQLTYTSPVLLYAQHQLVPQLTDAMRAALWADGLVDMRAAAMAEVRRQAKITGFA